MDYFKPVLLFLEHLVVVAPLLLTVLLGVSSLLDWKLKEQTTTNWIQASILTGLFASFAVLASMLIMGTRHVPLPIGDWVAIPRHYHFSIIFVFDRLSVPFVILSFMLAGTIGAFASRYMHRERGFNRFFVLYALFVLGMVVTSLAGTIETLFAGWELVGLSSALLVAFYQERPAPARNGLWVWIVYRVSDAALLLAAVAMHHMLGEGNFDKLLGGGDWPFGHSSITSSFSQYQALVVGLLLLVAVAGNRRSCHSRAGFPRRWRAPLPRARCSTAPSRCTLARFCCCG